MIPALFGMGAYALGKKSSKKGDVTTNTTTTNTNSNNTTNQVNDELRKRQARLKRAKMAGYNPSKPALAASGAI